jgi:hypothetical protein
MFSSSGRLDPVELKSDVLVHGGLKLPALQAQFRIPRLAQRPQDPIMDYLPPLSAKKQPTLPVELLTLTETLTQKDAAYRELDDGDLWAKALEHSGAMLVSAYTFIIGKVSSLFVFRASRVHGMHSVLQCPSKHPLLPFYLSKPMQYLPLHDTCTFRWK